MSNGARAYTRGIALVRIQVKLEAEVGRDPDHDVLEYSSPVTLLNSNFDDLPINDREPGGIRGSHVYVA
jgi:hypothetical protein